jgi:hypothetical protein
MPITLLSLFLPLSVLSSFSSSYFSSMAQSPYPNSVHSLTLTQFLPSLISTPLAPKFDLFRKVSRETNADDRKVHFGMYRVVVVSTMIRGTLNGWKLGGRYGVIMIRLSGGQPPIGRPVVGHPRAYLVVKDTINQKYSFLTFSP